MRISDLIHFISRSTAQSTAVPVSPEAWLHLSRKAFPRPDLLSWFDGLTSAPLPPPIYFPALVIAATFITVRSGSVRKVLTVEGKMSAATSLTGLFGGPEHHVAIDMSGADADLPTALPLHQVALTVGLFDQADERQAAALKLLWEVNYYSSARLFFLSGDVFNAWNGTALPPADESDVYRGLLQRQASNDLHVIYRDVAARRASRPG